MRHLGCKSYLTVDVATQTDGNQLVGVRCEVLSCYQFAVSFIAVTYYSRVDIECSLVFGNLTNS